MAENREEDVMAGIFWITLVCPYCGYEDPDSWEAPDGEGTRECPRCGREYAYETDRFFTTYEIGGSDGRG